MSTDDAASPDTAPVEHSPPQSQRSVVRFILFAVLILALIGLAIDVWARTSAQELHTKLEELLDKAPVREKPAIDAVHEAIGRTPSETYDHSEVRNTKVEEYRYRGALRSYVVYAYYQIEPEVRLDSVSLNQQLTKDDL